MTVSEKEMRDLKNRLFSEGSNIRIFSGDADYKKASKEYTLIKSIGAGAFGLVVLARSMATDEYVAIKCLYNELVDKQEMADWYDRFKTEIRLTKLMGDRSENVTRVIDAGMLVGEKGQMKLPCFAMQYVLGMSVEKLNTLIQGQGLLKFEEAYVLIRQSLEALRVAGLTGIVHRDIKPSNILIDENNKKVKITDFGVSYDSEERADRTIAEKIVGSRRYMSKYIVAGEYDVKKEEVKHHDNDGHMYCMRDGREVSVASKIIKGGGEVFYRRFQGPQLDIMPLVSIILPELFAGRHIFEGPDDEHTQKNIRKEGETIHMEDYSGKSETLRSLKNKAAMEKLNFIINKGKADNVKESYPCADEAIKDLEDLVMIQLGEKISRKREAEIIRQLFTDTIVRGRELTNTIVANDYTEGVLTSDSKNKSRVQLLVELWPEDMRTKQRIEDILRGAENELGNPKTTRNDLSFYHSLLNKLNQIGTGKEYSGIIKKLDERIREIDGGAIR
jgi:serine/threonine protein kinase